ncbi:HNH endonuclease [Desulfitobacterium hafniense]|uniref:HNH endonuclease n=1 Tax=Desulfitobacterium hafniense TaxID=49338 RepID=UPI00039BE621|nr:HNH endonuclease [Desulfitobacterium hafniense]
MKMFIGVTDSNWFNYLAKIQPDEVNFWQPGGRQVFKAIESNELFLFKLHSPLNYIAGGGLFVRHSFLPVSLAWEAFENKNGTADYISFRQAIYKYRKTDRNTEPDPQIGCIVLASPFFFKQSDWIPVPEDWKPNIVQGKTYSTESFSGKRLLQQIEEKLQNYNTVWAEELGISESSARYGAEQITKPRLGQGAFRVMVTEAYHRRCAVTGEKTLPVLEAAHIKPYSLEGSHETNNGLLLRKDLHTLFDRGYITITEDCHIEVSKRIKEDYGNGKEYYALHGKKLIVLPDNLLERPSVQLLRWHNENVYMS